MIYLVQLAKFNKIKIIFNFFYIYLNILIYWILKVNKSKIVYSTYFIFTNLVKS